MNLLDHFYLQHVRVTQLSGELVPPRESTDEREAKVELNLSPRPLKTDSGDELPGYRVTARLRCRGAHDDEAGPRFKAQVVAVSQAVLLRLTGQAADEIADSVAATLFNATATRLVHQGSSFIVTNPDAAGPTEKGIVPAAGAVAAMIQTATGVEPYVVGKPNPLMFRTALNFLDVHSEDTVMVGDNLKTDIRGGIEAGLELGDLEAATLPCAALTSPRSPITWEPARSASSTICSTAWAGCPNWSPCRRPSGSCAWASGRKA